MGPIWWLKYLPLSSYEICTILVHQIEVAKVYKKKSNSNNMRTGPELHHG